MWLDVKCTLEDICKSKGLLKLTGEQLLTDSGNCLVYSPQKCWSRVLVKHFVLIDDVASMENAEDNNSKDNPAIVDEVKANDQSTNLITPSQEGE